MGGSPPLAASPAASAAEGPHVSAEAPPIDSTEATAETPVAEHFRRVAAELGNSVALTTSGARYTYRELDRWSDAVAADLAAAGVPRDLPVALVTRDNALLVPAALGAVKAGHYFVTVDASDPDDRIALILRESRAAAALVEPSAGTTAALHDLPCVPIRELPRHPVPPPQRDPNRLLAVIFTSGTTGTPKAILVKQHGYVERSLRTAKGMGRGPGTRQNWTAVPGYTRAATGMFVPLIAGSTLCAFDARRESLDAFHSYIARERLTHLGMAPSQLRRLASVAPDDLDLSSLVTVSVTGDSLTRADLETFRALFPTTCELQVAYASTECGFVFRTVIRHDDVLPGPAVPMGKLLPNVDVWLVDEDGNDVETGQPGELIVRSRDVIEGYWNDAELTAQRVSVDAGTGLRTFRTGDLVRRDEHGYYYFVGRVDSRLKIYGRRIDPLEVERAVVGTGMVREAVAVGKRDANGELHLVAYVVPQPGKGFDRRALRAELRKTQPAWLVPVRIHEIDAIPTTRALKVDRAALAARAEPVEVSDSGARDDVERTLVEVWSRVIGAPVHVDDDFFDDHGGESVVAAHLATAVGRVTGTPIPMSLLLELNTVSRMAEYVRGATVAGKLAVLVQAGGPRPPVFCVTGMDGSVIKFRQLAEQLGTARPFYGLTFHGFDIEAFPSGASVEAACYAEAIRRIQPQGPYYLAGYSGGGRTALQIAKTLQRQGYAVAFVGMLDAAAAAKGASLWRRIRNRIDMVRQLPEGRLRQLAVEAATRPLAILHRRTRAALVRRGLAFPKPVRAANAAHRRMRKDFSNEPFAGVVDVFRARNGQGMLGASPDLGWPQAGAARLRFSDVPGDHNTMLTTHVTALGRAFRCALEEADRRLAESQ